MARTNNLAASATASGSTKIVNNGSSRFVIGPAPKSSRKEAKGRHVGNDVTMLGTPADQGVDEAKRLSNVADVPKSIVETDAFQVAAEACGVRPV